MTRKNRHCEERSGCYILATNEDSVIPIEVKTTLKAEDVNFFIEKLLHLAHRITEVKYVKTGANGTDRRLWGCRDYQGE
jgi:hypothetical protein